MRDKAGPESHIFKKGTDPFISGPLNAQIVQLGFLANMELPGQSWDYNNRFGNQYDAAGNFNFGAVSAAMGYSNYFILNAGGVLKEGEFLSQGKLDLNGIPFLEYPYGNQALKQAMVQAGIDYYLCNYQ